MSAQAVPAEITHFLENSQIALTVSSPRLPDDPIVAVNDSFLRMTGYGADEVVGRNCRFLQGTISQEKPRAVLRTQMAAQKDAQVLLQNFRKSGEAFDNYLFIFPILGGDDKPVFFIGSQFEIPQVDRVKSLKEHAAQLRDGLDIMNESRNSLRASLITSGKLLGLEARDLIYARLAALP